MMYNCGHCNAMIRLSDHGVHTTHVDHGARRLRDDAASQASEVQSQRPRLSAAAFLHKHPRHQVYISRCYVMTILEATRQ